MQQVPFFCFCFFVVSVGLTAQRLEEPYLRFSSAYKTLDAELLANTYTQSATLINVYNGTEPTSFRGRARIQEFFEQLFESAKKEEKTLGITFKISSRQQVEEGYLDNGCYLLEITDPETGTAQRFGKFSIVLQQESGVWKFAVDANASATQKEFESATPIGNKNR